MADKIARFICRWIGCTPVVMGYDDRGKGGWLVCSRCHRDMRPTTPTEGE